MRFYNIKTCFDPLLIVYRIIGNVRFREIDPSFQELLAWRDYVFLSMFCKRVDFSFIEIRNDFLCEKIEVFRRFIYSPNCHSCDYSDDDGKNEDWDPGSLKFCECVCFLDWNKRRVTENKDCFYQQEYIRW